MAESLRGSCQGTAMSSWPWPGLPLTAPFNFAYFYQGTWNFQIKKKMTNTHNSIITTLPALNNFSPTAFLMEC